MLKFLVRQQKIEILEREVIASDQISFVTLKFIFEGDWKNFHKVVQFTQDDETYNMVLGFDGLSCLLPAELHAGAMKMSVFGYDTENISGLRATTVPVTLNIRQSGFVGDEPPIPPTPDLYQQLLEKIGDSGNETDGKSAYEIAKEHGFDGTEQAWLESLKGESGTNGIDGKNGLSAYEIAKKNGYKDSEEKWLESLHGKDGNSPDLSEYVKTTDVENLIAENSHTHHNFTILEEITPEIFSENQRFQDWTKEQIHTLNESVDNFFNITHTHKNGDILDKITAEKIAEWDGISTLKQQLNGLSTNLTVVREKVDHNSARIGENEKNIAEIREILTVLQQQTSINFSGYTTLFDANEIDTYRKTIGTMLNGGFHTLEQFCEIYPHFCCAENNYALSYNQQDFGWDSPIFTCVEKQLHLNSGSHISICYTSGATENGEIYLVPAPGGKIDIPFTMYAQSEIQKGNAVQLDFRWLQSEKYVNILLSCETVNSGNYYLAWVSRSNNTHPMIQAIKVLEG